METVVRAPISLRHRTTNRRIDPYLYDLSASFHIHLPEAQLHSRILSKIEQPVGPSIGVGEEQNTASFDDEPDLDRVWVSSSSANGREIAVLMGNPIAEEGVIRNMHFRQQRLLGQAIS
jgi:hypothetical protein